MMKMSIVFWGSGILTIFSALFGVVAPQNLEKLTSHIQQWLTTNFGWYYLLVVALIVAFCLFLILSPVGSIRLGKSTDRPKYSNRSWFATLFSAGIGIGLVFWGAAEPLSHFAIMHHSRQKGPNKH